MTTKISGLFDAILGRMETIYPAPTFRHLVNPYVAELNDTPSLERGWGFIMGEAANTRLLQGNMFTVDRTFIIVNTIVQRGGERGIDIRQSAEKQLMEDQFLGIKNFHGNELSTDWDFEYTGDGGVEFVFAENQNFLIVRSAFSLKYSEQC